MWYSIFVCANKDKRVIVLTNYHKMKRHLQTEALKLKERKYFKTDIFVIAALLCIFIFTGCSGNKKPDGDVMVQITEPAQPTSTPTPTPLPTPIIDRPQGRYDASVEARSAEDEQPVEIGFDDEVMVLNPFYADSDLADEIVAKTQAPLFYIDEKGQAQAGIEYPCVAYEYQFIDDDSFFGNTAKAAKESGKKYKVLRVVLKEGINFSDGQPVTIDDVVYSAYVLGNHNYDGPQKYYENDIFGMNDYHTQVTAERIKKAETIKKAGINKDGTYPEIDGILLSEQKEFWGCWEEAGELFAKEIVNYVGEHYGSNAYVQAFLSNSLTWSRVSADESLKIAYAFAMWGYMKTYNSRTGIMTDTNGDTYDLNTTPLTYKDLYDVIFKYYQYDLDDKTGINYERPVQGNDEKRFEDYVEEVYLTKGQPVEVISGITTGAYRYDDMAMRGCVYFLIGEDVAPADINLYVVPKHIYLGRERVNELIGAGEYSLESVSESDNVITLVANDDYMLGSPKKKYIKYIWNE